MLQGRYLYATFAISQGWNLLENNAFLAIAGSFNFVP
jgi:hypothetical protein